MRRYQHEHGICAAFAGHKEHDSDLSSGNGCVRDGEEGNGSRVVTDRPPWISLQSGQEYCKLCDKYATSGHLASRDHQHRFYLYKLCEEELESKALEERPDWLEAKSGYDYCTLCGAYATDEHLMSKKHQTRLEWHEKNGATDSTNFKEEEGPPKDWGDPSHFCWRESWWYCKLCDAWSGWEHVKGHRHQQAVKPKPNTWKDDENGAWRAWKPSKAKNRGRNWRSDWKESGTVQAQWGSPKESEPWSQGWCLDDDSDTEGPMPTSPAGVDCVWKTVYCKDSGCLVYVNTVTGEKREKLPAAKEGNTRTSSISTSASLTQTPKDSSREDDIEWF